MARVLYYHTFKARGLEKFPIDMLRYDCCFPRTELDSIKIHEIFDRRLNDREVVKEIGLASISHGQWTPTEGRWASFGWRVCDVKVEHKLD